MLDLSTTIIAKSDQLNSDDLIGGPRTIKITRVAGMNDKEQPIAIFFEGDGGKPYKPGKSMRRVLVNFWGKNGEDYVGRSLTLFRDPSVEFGGIKVGGIRISHMTNLGDETEMALAVTRGAKRRFSVKPLKAEANGGGKPRLSPVEQVVAYEEALKGVEDFDVFREYVADERRVAWLASLREKDPALFERANDAQAKRFRELSPADDDEATAETLAEETPADDVTIGDDEGGDDVFPA